MTIQTPSILKRYLPYFLLALIFVCAELLINPVGNFPLNDDWNYGFSVKALLEQHRLIITCWSLAAALPHVFFGTLFCLPSGFSFNTLRLCTLCFSLAGLVSVYFLLSPLSANRTVLLLAIATIFFNPIYLELSNTFMVDIPFFAMACWTVYLLSARMNYAGKQATAFDIACAIAVTATCLTRQVGLLIPLAFAIEYIRARGLSRRNAITGACPLITSACAVAAFEVWLKTYNTLPFAYLTEAAYLRGKLSEGLASIASGTLHNIFIAAIYFGLFLLPLLGYLLPSYIKSLTKARALLFCLLAGEITILVSAVMLWNHALMPLADNVCFDFGLGPIFCSALKGALIWPSAPAFFRIAVTFAGIFGFASIVSLITMDFLPQESNESPKQNTVLRFYLLVLCLYLLAICLRGFFDRYLLFCLPFLMAYLAQKCPYPKGYASLALAISFLLLFACLSVAGVHDYLSYNRARWHGLNHLVRAGAVSPLKIDGGLEFNGWYAYLSPAGTNAIVMDATMKHGNTYCQTLKPLPNYHTIEEIPFRRWLTGDAGIVYILQKDEAR